MCLDSFYHYLCHCVCVRVCFQELIVTLVHFIWSFIYFKQLRSLYFSSSSLNQSLLCQPTPLVPPQQPNYV